MESYDKVYDKLIEELPVEIRLPMREILAQLRKEILAHKFKRSDDAVSAPDDNRPDSAESQKKMKPRHRK
jgi:hypothetical protein